MYEMPLFRRDEILLSWQVVDFVQRELGEARPEDRAHTLLTTLSCPHPSFEERESAESLLVGFVYQRGGGMRLYVRRQDTPGVIGCDVRLAEAGPAVMAEVFSRSGERELWAEPEGDQHCTAVLDLTH